ncbi:MAG: hypothetical protein ACK4VO_01555 [Pseudobdellovibrio sp.]
MAKNVNRYFILFFFILSSCQLVRKNTLEQKESENRVYPNIVASTTEVKNSTISNPNQLGQPSSLEFNPIDNPVQPQPSNIVTPTVRKSVPRFGVILSAGGAKTWAHVAILKEMQKYKFPIASIAGIEWGSVVAASYAHQASVSEVEWEISKFKDLDSWFEFTKAAFAKKTTFDFKIPFVCPSLNIKNKTIYLLNRGQIDQFIPYCLPSAGLIRPYGNSVAHMSNLNLIVQHLKATGVQKIILINVLGGRSEASFLKSFDSLENQIWSEHAASLRKNVVYDDLIEIELSDYGIDEFDKRKDIMVKATELSYNLVKKLAEKYKL